MKHLRGSPSDNDGDNTDDDDCGGDGPEAFRADIHYPQTHEQLVRHRQTSCVARNDIAQRIDKGAWGERELTL
ncbi:hypothetical protein BE61_52650 [Bradyrhizobium elkanii USDA 61]|nr:hypothetical protein BE61_52650 [Bradyrhizobium elkanii USDA 61]